MRPTLPASLPMPLDEVQVLHPGDVVCADRGVRLETLLGSCIAIILTDPRRTVAAMCHYVHAGLARHRDGDGNAHAAPALRAMQRQLLTRGLVPAMCDAYVYGGGNMFPERADALQVGVRNAEWAFAALAQAGTRVIAHDVGGHGHRRVSWTVGPQPPQVAHTVLAAKPARPAR